LLTEQIGLIVRRNIDADRSLYEYGIDSLGALELRTRIEAETGIRITTKEITTARGMADYILEKLVPAEEIAVIHASGS
jgi:polyketide synthase 5